MKTMLLATPYVAVECALLVDLLSLLLAGSMTEPHWAITAFSKVR